MKERRYDIDWLRVIAIGLLLIYHIAIVFQPWAMFFGFIKSSESIQNLWLPMTMLNVWRIPFLFFVSGMGVYFAIRKRNWRELLLERTKRILVPFLFGIVAISPLHFFLFQKYYGLPFGYMAHPAHLWFLGNICAYILLLTPIFFYLKNKMGNSLNNRLLIFFNNPFGPLLISIFFVLEVLLVKPAVYEMYAQTWHGFFLGLLAFFFGFLFVYSGKTFWPTVLKWRYLYLGLAITFFIVRLFIFDSKAPGYLVAIESNSWILAVFGFGYRYLNKPSIALSYLSQASYPVYIIHMFVLYAGASIFLPLDIPVFIQFVLVVLFTAVVCLLLFDLFIKRIRLLRVFFGLKLESRKLDNQKANAVEKMSRDVNIS